MCNQWLPPHCSSNIPGTILPQCLCRGCALCLDHQLGFPHSLILLAILISLKSPLLREPSLSIPAIFVTCLPQWTIGPRVARTGSLVLDMQQGGKYWLT